MTDIPSFVTNDVATTLADLRFREGVSVKAEVVRAVEQQVTDVLVDFMGPGADPFFLDMYALASGSPFAEKGIVNLFANAPSSNKSPASQAYYDEIDYRRLYVQDRRRQLLRGMSLDIVRRMGLNPNLVLPWLPAPKPGYEEELPDEFVHALIDYLGPGAPYADLLKNCQRMTVLGPFPCEVYRLDSSVYFLMRPLTEYRTALMGELAEPWTNLPPPYDRYVPARRQP